MFVSRLLGGVFRAAPADRRVAARRVLAAGDRRRQRRRAAGRVHQRRRAVRGPGARRLAGVLGARRCCSGGASNPSIADVEPRQGLSRVHRRRRRRHDVRAAYWTQSARGRSRRPRSTSRPATTPGTGTGRPQVGDRRRRGRHRRLGRGRPRVLAPRVGGLAERRHRAGRRARCPAAPSCRPANPTAGVERRFLLHRRSPFRRCCRAAVSPAAGAVQPPPRLAV